MWSHKSTPARPRSSNCKEMNEFFYVILSWNVCMCYTNNYIIIFKVMDNEDSKKLLIYIFFYVCKKKNLQLSCERFKTLKVKI